MSQPVPKVCVTKTQRATRFYLPELDLLRCFAVLGVFIYHVPPSGHSFYDNHGLLGSLGTCGAFGVDLFFTLSGYLITRLLLRERDETGDINLKAFYARRTLRIWPLYYFSIGLAFLLTHLPASIASAPPFLGSVYGPIKPSAYVFMAVFLFNFNFDNCLLTNPIPLTGLLWSVSVEEQFYAFWPWFARYVPRKRVVVVPILMIAVGVIVRAALTFNIDRLVWNYTFVHFDSIAVGILVALMPTLNLGTSSRALSAAMGLASWVFAAYCCGIPEQKHSLYISMGYPAIALGSGAFLLAALGAEGLRTSRTLLRCLTYLGKISYGIYVYDIIAISTARLLLFRGLIRVFLGGFYTPWAELSLFIVLAFALNVGLAAASYRWLEAPFLRLKERFTRIPTRAV